MKRLLSVVVLLTLAVTPLMVFAQDGGDTQEYTSEDELLTASYPADWAAQDTTDTLGLVSVVFASDQAVLDGVIEGGSLTAEAGQQLVVVALLSRDLLTLFEVEVEEEPDTMAWLDAAAMALLGTDISPDEDAEAVATAEATEEETAYGEPEVIELSDEREAGYLTVADTETEGSFMAFEVGEDVVVVVMGATGPDEYTEELDQMVRDIAASVEYTGTADDAGGPLWEMMQGMETGTAEPGEGDTSMGSLDGETLVSERCTVCHDRARIDAKDEDEEGWTEIVDEMIGYGAELNAEERDAVIAYLVETH